MAEANEDLYPDKGYIMLACLATIEPPAAMKAVQSQPEIYRKRVDRDMETLLGRYIAWSDKADPP